MQLFKVIPIVLAAHLFALAGSSNAQSAFRIVSKSGDAAPLAGTGITIAAPFQPPVISNTGSVVWRSGLAGGNTTSDSNVALWIQTGGTNSLIARTGMVAPGLNAAHSNALFKTPIGRPININDNDVVVFHSELSGPGTPGNAGVWTFQNSNISLAFEEGYTVFPTGNMGTGTLDLSTTVDFVRGLSPIAINSSDELGFRAATSSGAYGIWRLDQGGNPFLVARDGLTGSSTPGVFVGLQVAVPRINVQGNIVYGTSLFSSVSGAGAALLQDNVTLYHDGMLAIDGDGSSNRGRYYKNNFVPSNGAGSGVVFAADTHEGDIPQFSLESGVWVGDGSSTVLVAESGQSAPGPAGSAVGVFAIGFNYVFEPIINFSSDVVFSAYLVNSTEITPGSWKFEKATNSLQYLVARNRSIGTTSPQLVPPTTTWSGGRAAGMNGFGHVVVVGSLNVGGDILLCLDPRYGMIALARQGTAMTVAPGVTRTILDISTVEEVSGGGDGAARCINDRGQLVARLRFTNNEEAIVLFQVSPPSCNPADIAYDDGTSLRTPVIDGANNGVTEGDFNLFFGGFFDADIACDIATDEGVALPPFGPSRTTNNGVTEGDYNLFFSIFFDGCQ